MIESLLNQALTWGFTCCTDAEGQWLVLPKNKREKWQLKSSQERWQLVVNGVPQINFCSQEAKTFLERRHLSTPSRIMPVLTSLPR